MTYNHVDEIWSIDLADFSDYKSSNKNGFRCKFVVIDKLLKYTWCVPLKKNAKLITAELSNILTTSKRSPLKTESDREAEICNTFFQNFLKAKNTHHYSKFTVQDTPVAQRVLRTIRNLLRKPVLLKVNADWLSEISSVTMKYNNTYTTQKNDSRSSSGAKERKNSVQQSPS